MFTHRQARLGASILAITLALSALVAAPVLAAGGQTFVNDANEQRATNKLAPVAWNALIDQITVERGDQMASAGVLEHDMAYVQNRMNQLGICWQGFGEIIYWTSATGGFDPQWAVNAWMKSAPHKAIMLGDFNAAAGSYSTSSKGTYAVMVFVKMCSAPAPSDPGESVRVAGADRFATAAALSAASFPSGASVAYVATGANFPDALAAGPAAAHAGGPVLLVTRYDVPDATRGELGRLKPDRIVVLGGAGAVADSVVASLRAYASSGTVSRIAGADRFTTAALISKAHFPAGVGVAYIATGANFPDALSGGAAAGMHDGPVLLVQKGAAPGATLAELGRLRPKKVVILGSSSVISDTVASAVGAAAGAPVSRLFGQDRYQTAVKVSQANYSAGGPSTVYVATGANFPDGLSAGPVAGAAPGPLLLVPSSYLPSSVAAELSRLAPDTVVVLGGSGAISNAVVQAINAAVP